MRIRSASVGLALLAAACASAVSGHGRTHSSCPPVFFGVAGSGQGPQNPPPEEIPPAVSPQDAAQYGTTVGLLKTDLTELAGAQLASTSAIDYPAIPATQYVGKGGLTGDLDRSEAVGAAALIGQLRAAYAGGCDGRPVLLSGYSQGAEVVVRAVGRLSAVEQAGVTVALFGNPSYLPGQPGDYPGDSLATGIRPSFRHVALRLPPAVRRRTIDVCATGDPVCGVDPDRTSVVGKVEFVLTHVHIHTHEYAFGPEGYAAIAAKFLWDHRTH